MFDAKAHDELLRIWEEKQDYAEKGFIKDGILDVERWMKAPLKVLFLLKEPYLENPDDMKKPSEERDLRVWLRRWVLRQEVRNAGTSANKKKIRPTWQTLADWAYLALHCAHSNPAELLAKRNPYESAETLLNCAVVNIKKADGKRTSNPKELKKIAKRDRCYLQRQLEMIGPEIIICGKTWNAFKKVYDIADGDFRVLNAQNGHRAIELGSNIFLKCRMLDFCHPNHRYSKAATEECLVSLLKNSVS